MTKTANPTFAKIFFVTLVISVILNGFFGINILNVSAEPTTQPLVQFNDLEYLGAFRVPTGGFGSNRGFDFGGRPLAYNPANNSLFMGNIDGQIAEIDIPTPVISSNLNNLATATVLQNFVDPTEGNIAEINAVGPAAISGLLVTNERLYGTAFIYYDASASQTKSHYSRSLNLSEDSATPLYQLSNTPQAGYVSGWMANIPTEWQTLLGGTAVTGQCCIPIVSRTSFGPSAFAWTPANLGKVNPLPATALLFYTGANPTLGPWSGSNTVYGGTTSMGGLALINGTRTALYIGTNGTGIFCYGGGTGDLAQVGFHDGEQWCYDPANSSKGQHAYPYNFQMWAYDLNDWAAVKAGTKNPWDVVPYGVWNFDVPVKRSESGIGSVAYDSERKLLYFTVTRVEPDYSARPLVEVYRVNNASSVTSPLPMPQSSPTPSATPPLPPAPPSLTPNPPALPLPRPTPPTSTPPPSVFNPGSRPADGTLIKDRNSPAIYVMDNGYKRPFASFEVFTSMGYGRSHISIQNTSSIPLGEGIFTAQRHPRGSVVLDNGTIYFLGNDIRYPFPNPEVFFSWGHTFAQVVAANAIDLDIPVGPIATIRD